MVSLAGIEEAYSVIDPVFLDTPQFRSEAIGAALDAEVVLKIECLNPIRSFKGRGASYFAFRHEEARPRPWLCASAGNFGQGLAYAARKYEIPIVIFAARTANPLKVERMRKLGAEVRLVGEDFDAAKEACRRYAEDRGLTFVEDGREDAITEGAGTMAIEILRWPRGFDAVVVPLGNGALINGVGTWIRERAPDTEIVGAGIVAAPAMERSFRAGRPIVLTEPVRTIADGVAARVPVPEAVETMRQVVDDVLLVEERAIVEAMQALFRETGLVVEGAGAVSLAAIATHRDRFRGKRILLLVGGGNADPADVKRYLCGGAPWENA